MHKSHLLRLQNPNLFARISQKSKSDVYRIWVFVSLVLSLLSKNSFRHSKEQKSCFGKSECAGMTKGCSKARFVGDGHKHPWLQPVVSIRNLSRRLW